MNLGVHMSLRYEVALSEEMELKHVHMSRCIGNEKNDNKYIANKSQHGMEFSER